jgi:1,4-dihydroxy-2-naphthoate octaprenyltransferase
MTAASAIRPASLSAWVLAARPKTLSAAAAPVLVGAATTYAAGGPHLGPFAAALAGALLLQIGANFANDVFDYEKGADTSDRLGPTRAVQAGLLSPRAVRFGMLVVFALALLIGVYLTFVAGPIIVLIGLLSIASAIAYTGGPYPLGYHGLGDLFVFVFFGPVAVCGTAFVQVGSVPPLAFWASLPVGALSTAILVVNNLRDIDTDRSAGKRTLAVRFGERGALSEYFALMLLSYSVPVGLVVSGALAPLGLLPLATLPMAIGLCRDVSRQRGSALNPLLAKTAKLLALYGLTFMIGIAAGLKLGLTVPR